MTRDEAQPAWEKIVSIGFSDYSSLTPEQRVWFSVEPLTTDGITDHYVNSLFEHNQETIADLKILGFADIAEMLITVNSLFKNGTPPLDINERNDELGNLDESAVAVLDAVETQFWKRCDELEEALFSYINETGIGELD